VILHVTIVRQVVINAAPVLIVRNVLMVTSRIFLASVKNVIPNVMDVRDQLTKTVKRV
jgi:uncharacterized membrane protein